jgi:hypothetical protein
VNYLCIPHLHQLLDIGISVFPCFVDVQNEFPISFMESFIQDKDFIIFKLKITEVSG